MAKLNSHNALRCLCEGAIAVALATVLGLIKFWQMPNGGSITLNMLPLFVFALRWGAGPGLLASFMMGLFDFILGGSYAIGWQSIIGDYLMAYTFCGLAGLFRGKEWGVFVGSIVGALGRWVVVFVTGATLWAEYAPAEVFGMSMSGPWMYSALYNAVYVGLSLVIILVVEAAMYVPLKKYLLGQDIKRG